jgi:hypothetical protein
VTFVPSPPPALLKRSWPYEVKKGCRSPALTPQQPLAAFSCPLGNLIKKPSSAPQQPLAAFSCPLGSLIKKPSSAPQQPLAAFSCPLGSLINKPSSAPQQPSWLPLAARSAAFTTAAKQFHAPTVTTSQLSLTAVSPRTPRCCARKTLSLVRLK